ncbi:MAG: YraN family protein [Eubacteriales bacterium]
MNKRQVGNFYEDMATTFLKEQGIQIIERNFRCKQGEVDIIGEDNGTLLFLEVKYRKNECLGFPYEAITLYKQRKICKVANYYRYYKRMEKPLRYDVISICGDQIQWFQNAFNHTEYSW